MKHTIKLLTVAITLAAILTLTGCPGPVNTIEPPVWDDGVVTTEPTCTTEGVKTYTCSNGETRTETIPALGHDMGDWGDWVVTVKPTTTSVGKKIRTRTCKREGCNYSEPWEETVPMLISNDPSDTNNDDTSNDNEDTNNTTEETQEHNHTYIEAGCDVIKCDEHYEFNNEDDYQTEIRIVASENINTFVSLYFSFDADNLTNYSYIEIAKDGNWIELNNLINRKPSYSSYSIKEIKVGIGNFTSCSNPEFSLSELKHYSPIYVILE